MKNDYINEEIKIMMNSIIEEGQFHVYKNIEEELNEDIKNKKRSIYWKTISQLKGKYNIYS